MKSSQDPPLLPRQTRWIERLMPYSYTFKYIKGSENLVANTLSRCLYMLNSVTVVHSMLAGLLARMKVAASQNMQYQQDVSEIMKNPHTLRTEPPTPPPNPSLLDADTESPIRNDMPSLNNSTPCLESPSPTPTNATSSNTPEGEPGTPHPLDTDSLPPPDLPRSEWPTSRFTKYDRIIQNRLIIYPNGVIVVSHDNEIRTLLLTEAHDSRMGGHFGIEKTLEKIKRFWTWNGVAHDVELYVQSCVPCQKTKYETSRPKGLLYPLVASRP